MHKELFFDLVDDLSKISTKAEGDAFLRQFTDHYGLSTAAYLGINLPTKGTHGDAYVSCTFTPDWLARYDSANYLAIDPVVKSGFTRIAPFDWGDIDKTSPSLKSFFGEAHEHGIGRQGISVPIRGYLGELALFSVNADCSDVEWKKFRQHIIRDVQLIGYHFHEHVLRRERISLEAVNLTPKQILMLRWAAEGKTDWETARICRLSQRAVRFHLSCAFTALGAVNKVQAVAKAAKLHLI